MKLIQPAVYEHSLGGRWVRLHDVLEMAKRDFAMDPDEVWSDLSEWGKPGPGYAWTLGEGLMDTESDGPPNDLTTVYIQAESARHFYLQAQIGIRAVHYDPVKKGHNYRWVIARLL